MKHLLSKHGSLEVECDRKMIIKWSIRIQERSRFRILEEKEPVAWIAEPCFKPGSFAYRMTALQIELSWLNSFPTNSFSLRISYFFLEHRTLYSFLKFHSQDDCHLWQLHFLWFTVNLPFSEHWMLHILFP